MMNPQAKNRLVTAAKADLAEAWAELVEHAAAPVVAEPEVVAALVAVAAGVAVALAAVPTTRNATA